MKPYIIALDFSPLLEEKQCSFLIEGESKEVCPQQYRYIFDYLLNRLRYLFGLIFIFIGIGFLIVERKAGIPFVIITSFYSFFLIFISIYTQQVSIEESSQVWIAVGVSVIGGIVGSILSLLMIDRFTVFVSAFYGRVAAIIVHQWYLCFIDWKGDFFYWVLIVFFSFVFGAHAEKFPHNNSIQTLTILVAIWGGYFTILGLKLVFGVMPYESMTKDLKQYKEAEALQYYQDPIAFSFLMVLLSFLGINLIHERPKRKSSDESFKRNLEKLILP